MINSLSRHLGACAALLLLVGCGVGPVAYQQYTLNPQVTVSPEAPTVPWQLAVATPEASADLDNSRVALVRGGMTFDYFDAAWTDRAPILVQNTLVQAFQASHRVKGVSRDLSALNADYLLKLELPNFEAEYSQPDAPPQVVVRIDAKLVKLPERDVIGSFSTRQAVNAADNKLDAIMAAFNTALGAADQQMVEWSLRMLPPTPPEKKHYRRKPAPAPEAQNQTAPQTPAK